MSARGVDPSPGRRVSAVPRSACASTTPLALVFGLGVWEILLILGLLVLLFGARRLPQIARGLGSGIRNFKGELRNPGDGPPDGGDDRSG